MEYVFISLLLATAVVTPVIYYGRREMRGNQHKLDTDRSTYELIYAKGLTETAVHDYLRSIGNTLRGRLGLIKGVPTVAFEVWSTPKGFSHRLRVPSLESEYLIGQLEAHIPGIDITPMDELTAEDERLKPAEFTLGVELYMSEPMRKLRISSSDAHARKILEAMRSDEAGEIVLLQWLISHSDQTKADGRMVSSRPTFWQALILGVDATPEEAADRKAKAAEQQFSAVGRIAAVAKDEKRPKS